MNIIDKLIKYYQLEQEILKTMTSNNHPLIARIATQLVSGMILMMKINLKVGKQIEVSADLSESKLLFSMEDEDIIEFKSSKDLMGHIRGIK